MEKTKKETAEKAVKENPILKAADAALKAPTVETSEKLYNAIMKPVNAGKVNPLKALADLTALEKAITQARKDVNEFFAQKVLKDYFDERANDTTLTEKERASKQVDLFGVTFQYKKSGVRYDYSKYVDTATGEYIQNTEYNDAAKELKRMEEHLKTDGKCIERSGMSVSVILKTKEQLKKELKNA